MELHLESVDLAEVIQEVAEQLDSVLARMERPLRLRIEGAVRGRWHALSASPRPLGYRYDARGRFDLSPPPTQEVREASGSRARLVRVVSRPPSSGTGLTEGWFVMSSSRAPFMLTVLAALAALACCARDATASQGEGQSTARQSAPESAPQEKARPEPTTETPPRQAELERDCPMTVPGAQARAEDTTEGALLIVTTPEQAHVAELRQRSHNMLQRQQEQGTSARHGMDQAPGIQYRTEGGGTHAGSAGSPSVPAYARIEDTAQGVAISYSAKKPSQRGRLRSDIRETAEKMEPGQCPGMAPAEPG